MDTVGTKDTSFATNTADVGTKDTSFASVDSGTKSASSSRGTKGSGCGRKHKSILPALAQDQRKGVL